VSTFTSQKLKNRDLCTNNISSDVCTQMQEYTMKHDQVTVIMRVCYMTEDCGGTVVKVLCYKSEGHWFDSIWCHWNFLLT